ncbi:MAG: hypothetical protein ACYDD6_08885 [Acidimicrobiales bacterium]
MVSSRSARYAVWPEWDDLLESFILAYQVPGLLERFEDAYDTWGEDNADSVLAVLASQRPLLKELVALFMAYRHHREDDGDDWD